MSQDSVILNKSLKFAARIGKLYRYLSTEKHETIISKQKETAETEYWRKLLVMSEYLTEAEG